MHQLRRDMRELSARIDGLTPYCILSIQLPDVQGTVLKNLDCPNLHTSKWVSPGYFTTIKKIRAHVLNHPVQGSYYLTLVLGNLDKSEPAAHAVVTQGKPPENLEELFSRLAFAFMQPRACQRILTDVLDNNGRLADPIQQKGISENCEKEVRKNIVFFTVLEEVQNMREFYQQQLKDQPMKLAAHLGQGCFTHDFLAVLMTNTPSMETMNLVDQLQSHEFGKQIDLLKMWAKDRLNRLMSMKNLTITMVRTDRESSPQRTKTDARDKGLNKKAEQAVKDALKKFNPAMAQMSQTEPTTRPKAEIRLLQVLKLLPPKTTKCS